jgi:hypothetical protein
MENKIQHVRDTTFAEDASRVRIKTAARAIATLRNLLSAPSPSPTTTNIATGLRKHNRDATRPLTILDIT